MAKLDQSYFYSQALPFRDIGEFANSGLPEVIKLKSLISAVKSLFHVHDNFLTLSFYDNRTYGIDIYTTPQKRVLLGRIFFLSKVGQLHIYDLKSNIPAIAWSKDRKIITSNFQGLFSKMDIEKVFTPLVNACL
jgi:hypothetical protein